MWLFELLQPCVRFSIVMQMLTTSVSIWSCHRAWESVTSRRSRQTDRRRSKAALSEVIATKIESPGPSCFVVQSGASLETKRGNVHKPGAGCQFVIALDIIEDFLSGEGYKFFRLVIFSFRPFYKPVILTRRASNSEGRFNAPGRTPEGDGWVQPPWFRRLHLSSFHSRGRWWVEVPLIISSRTAYFAQLGLTFGAQTPLSSMIPISTLIRWVFKLFEEQEEVAHCDHDTS